MANSALPSRVRRVLLLSLVFGLFSAPAALWAHSIQKKAPITIGAYASATGTLQIFGSYEQQGWALAQTDINKQGGILGHPLQITFKDDGSDQNQARAIVQDYVSQNNVIGISGPTSSANAFASQPVAVTAHVPVVAISNNADGIVQQGVYVHRISVAEAPLDTALTKTIVATLKIKRAALLYAQDDPFSISGYQAFKAELQKLKIKITSDVAYNKATADFAPQINSLQAGSPQALFVAAYSSDAGNFLRQARQQGLNQPVVGNASFNSPGQFAIAGTASQGVVVASQWYIGDRSKLNVQFVKEYRKRFGRDPGNFAALAYNSAYVIKDALLKSKKLTRAGLQSGLMKLKGYTALGAAIKFVDRDSTMKKPILLMSKNGQLVLFKASAFKP